MEFKEGTCTGLFTNEDVSIVLGIPGDVLLEKGIVKVYDGIAGAGKSSAIDYFLKSKNIEYGRYTSTNKLKRDAIRRYGGNVDTIAGGLFKTVNGCFYCEMKNPLFDVIVIDEILQSDVSVFDWINEFKNECSIIVCTDSCQMLAQDCSERMLERFYELKENSVCVELTETKRARSEETKKEFLEYYESVKKDVDLFKSKMGGYKKIFFDDLVFNENDVYLCHTNEIENMLFHKFSLFDRYDIPLIPKGVIAKNPPKNKRNYPILPQEDSKNHNGGYFQPEMVGTPTRYQGSEVQKGMNLYYIIEEDSVIEPREIYTVITRMQDISSFVLVYIKNEKVRVLNEFNKRPIRKAVWYSVPDDIEIDGAKLSDFLCDDGKIRCNEEFFKKILEGMDVSNGAAYKDSAFVFDGHIVVLDTKNNEPEYKTNLYSMISKEPEFCYKYMPDFMKAFEMCQYRNFDRKKLVVDYLFGAMSCYQESYADTPFPNVPDYVNIRNKRSYQYGIDLKSSYAHILNNALLPTGTIFSKEPGAGIDWYMIYCDQCGEGALVTHEYKEFIESMIDVSAYFVCSTGAKVGSRMGAILHEKCHKSKEDNEFVKKIKWGILDRPWLSGRGYSDVPDYYVLEESNNHQLLMISIRSKQAEIIARIRNCIYGELRKGCSIADCLYFDFGGDIKELGDNIAKAIPGYDFRIFENSEDDKAGNVLYKTYQDIYSKREIKNEKERIRRLTSKIKCAKINL